MSSPTPLNSPLTFEEIIKKEREFLRPQGSRDDGLSALCISGGGIRSATFALGAIQGLAEANMIDWFDYMSTVSGGGFLGGWVTAWKERAGGIGKIAAALKPGAKSDGEPDPIQHLR